MIVPFNCPQCQAVIRAESGGLRRRLVPCPGCGANVQMPEKLTVGPGAIIGNGYRLERKLHDSSLGEVYLAVQEKSNRSVSVEVLSGQTSQDAEKVSRLMQEIELVAAMKHPNIVEAIEAGQDGETYFLVNAHEPGSTLEEYLKQHGTLEEKQALRLIGDVARGLKYAWEEKKVLHRDVKPANIFVTEAGQAKLAGFGIAKSSEGQSMGLTGVGFTIGTPEYMSPEQIKAADDLDFRADLYSLGCVAYECLTGELPFDEKAPILLMQKHMDETPVSPHERNPMVSAGASAVVEKMLKKGREERHASWDALLGELEKLAGATGAKRAPILDGKVSSTADTVAGGPVPTSAGGGSKTLLLAAVLFGVLVGVIALVVALKGCGGAPAAP